MIQRKIFLFGVLALLFLVPQGLQAQRGSRIQTIVIDAGHGGKDSGAIGRVTTEKDINLSVALKFGEYIQRKLPSVRVVYTRTTDKFVELSERAAIANRNNADVFVSIHCNSTEGLTRLDGVETFVIGETNNEANLNVAKKENAVILLEDNTDAYDNFDPNNDEAYSVFSSRQSGYRQQSLQLASKVQRMFSIKAGRHSRGVQQGGLLVLWKTNMPSILVELGFITNPSEEQYMNSDKGQDQMAKALYQAFAAYKSEYDSGSQVAIRDLPKPKETEEPAPVEKPEPKEERVEAKEKPSEHVEEKPVGNQGDTYYTVQISTIKKKKPVTDDAFRGVKDVTIEEYKGAYRYYSGRFGTRSEADARVKEVAKYGFKDAFVVYYKDGERKRLD